ncbi:hypothetical protein [Streptomyces sp. DH37]|uniref:hypothetical protein n=1 Tax=Streptomyces sp. DH37 TaxID=3040122 RepID=UPI0024421792|nr:hypothetical protein [Streptomyces sp. DH37]MDG9706270.1 hypothetical protein [Streptomyces sp. DH37]
MKLSEFTARRRQRAEEKARAKHQQDRRRHHPEEKARAKHQQDRRRHHPEVAEEADRLLSAVPFGSMRPEEAWLKAWRSVHGSDTRSAA